MTTHDTFRTNTPTCPHCGYAMDTDDMLSCCGNVDLFALAPDEGRECIKCPSCDAEYWVQGSYAPRYTSAFFEEQL